MSQFKRRDEVNKRKESKVNSGSDGKKIGKSDDARL